MKEELQQQLIAIFPPLFQDQDEREPFPMFGFECGDGWFELLKDLITELKVLCEKEGYETKVTQVKEKFGGLRFYVHCEPDAVSKLIRKAEKRAEKTCELCGKEGKIVPVRPGSYWVACLCPQCLQNYSATCAAD